MTVMAFSTPFEGFRLAYDRAGSGSPVVLLHGWPGDRTDYDRLVPQLTDHADVIAPDLRGFGESDKHHVDVEQHYSGLGQANASLRSPTSWGSRTRCSSATTSAASSPRRSRSDARTW
jgi:pimeloyl-ACP methyl ester carboxylesterase